MTQRFITAAGVGLLLVAVAWLLDRMARNEEATYRLLILSVGVLAAALLIGVSLVGWRRRGR